MIYTITKGQEGLLRDFLRQQLSLSSSQITRLKAKPFGITVNGEKKTVRYILKEGDVLRLDISDEKPSENIIPVNIPLDILYEDEGIIAVNKPHGMPTHPSHGHFDDTLANALTYYLFQKGEKCIFRAVNRLDKDTSGVVLCAKNAVVAAKLCKTLSCGGVKKEYTALLHGKTSDSGIIEKNIKRKEESVIFRCVCGDDEGKSAVTHYKTVTHGEKYSLVKLTPITGRTHQLRVHTSYIGTPIVGDVLYGKDDGYPLMLHASSLTFLHPETGEEIKITADIPERFKMIYENSKED